MSDFRTKPFPKAAVLELTYRCNHRCKFCSCPWEAPDSTYPKGQELGIEEWKRCVDILYDKGVVSFSITGGEALLKDGFEEIIRYIRSEGNCRGLNHPIVLISNGLKMKEEYLKLFLDMNVHLSMSLPGYSTFQEHTGVDNADGVLYWFRKANEMGLSTTVNITVTRKNYDELFETISLGLINGASDVLLNRFLPGGRGLSYLSELLLSPNQINGMLSTAEEVLAYARRYAHLGTEIPYCAIQHPEKLDRVKVGYQCAAVKNFFVIDPSGQIRTCNHSPRVVGHIFQKPLITDTDYWNMFATGDYKPEACEGCKMIPLCDCGCREVANILHGNPKGVDTSAIQNSMKQN